MPENYILRMTDDKLVLLKTTGERAFEFIGCLVGPEADEVFNYIFNKFTNTVEGETNEY